MGHRPCAVRYFAEWSNRFLSKANVKLTLTPAPGKPPRRVAAADAKCKTAAKDALSKWRHVGRSKVLKNPGEDNVCPTYDGVQAAAAINLHELQTEEPAEVVVLAKKILGMMTRCPASTPKELFLDGTWVPCKSEFSCQRYWMKSDCAVRTRFYSLSNDDTQEAIATLEQHALIDDNSYQLGMHQLMADAVRAELQTEAPGSCPGVLDLQALLTARYGTEEDVYVDAGEYAAMRVMGDAAEYAVAAVVGAVGEADMALQRWACGMYLRLARVQVEVASDADACARLLAAAASCLQRMQGQSCAGLRELEWRVQLYWTEVPYIKGDYDEALSGLRKVVCDFADCGNAELMGHTLNGIGSALWSKGEHDKAVEYHTRALDICMERLGPRHPHVATLLGNIGSALQFKGEHDKAVEYHTRALDICMERLGPRHPDVAASLNNMGSALEPKGDDSEHDKAVEYYTRALDILMERLGPRHPHVATSLSNIGNELESKREHDKAVEYHTRALDIRMERLGPRHPNVAASLGNIGSALWSKGEHDKAAEYHTRALDIQMERLGPRHPHVATSLNNIGGALKSKGEHDEAVEYFTRALDIRFATLGSHPDTAGCLFSLSSSLMRVRQPQAASDCVISALHMLVSNPDFHHALIQKMKNNGCQVHILVQQQRWSDALSFLPALDRAAALVEGTSAEEGGGNVCLYLCAAAKVYRESNMPSLAAAAMRRAAAAIRRLGVPLEWTDLAIHFRNAGLSMDAEELDKVAKTLDKLSQSSRRGPEPKVPDIPAHAPPAPRLRLPVRALARPRCAEGGTATLTL
jgi:tetratricopeptide (TPR) repeat protein